jgi:GntR family transcriptional regulator, transcriptional repressor for pyruvate dehydrogenase complex
MSQLRSAPRLADTVASELEARILDGSLKPGDLLPSERELAKELGVSRPPVREAIQKLAAKGLLSTHHGLGTRVTDRLEAHFSDPWQDLFKGHPLLQRDLLEFRRMLEAQAAYLAAERALDIDIERLDAVYQDLCTAYDTSDTQACIDKDVQFHQTIAEASHNVLIGHLTASLMRVIHSDISNSMGFLHAQPSHWTMLKAQHHAIWLAIREHQPELAANAARNHVDFVRKTMSDSALDNERRQTSKRRLG